MKPDYKKSRIPKVSVIVPVFEPGKSIQTCIHSIRNQTLEDIEILFIDDCGTDGSMDLVRAAAAEDERIHILSNGENVGSGVSRNVGIEEAKGEFLSFIDADDSISPNFLESLYRKAVNTGAKIVRGTFADIDEDGADIRLENAAWYLDQIKAGIQRHAPLYETFIHAHWCAIYKRSWIVASGIRYGSSTYGEDSTFLLRACWNSPDIAIEEKACYYYVNHAASLTHELSSFRISQQQIAMREQIDFILSHSEEEVSLNYITKRLRWNLAIQAAAGRTEGLEEDAAAYLEDISIQYRRLPWYARLAEMSPEAAALNEYGENVVSLPYHTGKTDATENYLEPLRRCIRFAEMHPDRPDIYEQAIKNCIGYILSCENILRKSQDPEYKSFRKKFRDVLLSYNNQDFLLNMSISMRLFCKHGIYILGLRNYMRNILKLLLKLMNWRIA